MNAVNDTDQTAIAPQESMRVSLYPRRSLAANQ